MLVDLVKFTIHKNNVKHSFVLVLIVLSFSSFGQSVHDIHFPDSVGWNILNENEELTFDVKAVNNRE